MSDVAGVTVNPTAARALPAYARILAGSMVHQQRNKRLLGKPYLKYGQCFGIWGYLFQVGGILARKHNANLDAFGPAFLGWQGERGAIRSFFATVANKDVTYDRFIAATSFFDYVQAEFVGRLGYTGNVQDYCLGHIMDRLPLTTAAELGWQYAEQGAALGAIHPHLLRAMFERTYALRPKEEWEQAYAAGLDIPERQDVETYEDAEETENKQFIDYCQDARPDHYAT